MVAKSSSPRTRSSYATLYRSTYRGAGVFDAFDSTLPTLRCVRHNVLAGGRPQATGGILRMHRALVTGDPCEEGGIVAALVVPVWACSGLSDGRAQYRAGVL